MSNNQADLYKYNAFCCENIARFVITNQFKDDYVSELLEKPSEEKDKKNFFLYAVYEHDENFVCIGERKTFEKNSDYLMFTVSQLHKQDLRRKTVISQLNFYKRMTYCQKKWVDYLFEVKKERKLGQLPTLHWG